MDVNIFASYSATKERPIAGRDELLKVQTEILLDKNLGAMERLRASELISRMQGYMGDGDNDSKAATSVLIVPSKIEWNQ